METPPPLPRYRALATQWAEELRAGRYPPGARLPSVRQLCAEHRASLATVTHALHGLEDTGLIEARPRLGFFVRAGVARAAPAPGPEAIALAGRRKRLIDLATTQADCLSLSHLALDPALLPTRALKRQLMQLLRGEAEVLATGSVFGSEVLREQLARRSRLMACDFRAEDIVVTHGQAESMELCLRLLTQAGDLVAVPSPAPLRALEIMASLGLRALEIPAPADGGLSVPALAFALQHHRVAACLVEANFASTDGSLMSDAAKQQLAALVAQHHVPLIECDMMGDLHRGPQRPRPVRAFDTSGQVLYCGNFACLTGPGFSLGYIESGRHRHQLRAARSVHGDLVPSLVEQALAGLLGSGAFEPHVRRLRQRLAAQLAAHRAVVLASFPAGTRVSTPQGAQVMWVELPGRLDTAALLAPARAAGYTFVPGAVFCTGAQFDHCLRITASQPLDAAREEGLRTVGRLAGEALARLDAESGALDEPQGPTPP